MSTEEESVKVTVPLVVFKKRSRANVRQRESGGDDAPDDTDISKKLKSDTRGKAQFTTKTTDTAVRFAYEGTGEIQEQGDQGATRMLETETAYDQDARARREAVLAMGGEYVDDGKYRGMNAYKDWKAVRFRFCETEYK